MKWQTQLTVNDTQYTYIDLAKITQSLGADLSRLPYSIRVLLESVARHQDEEITEDYLPFLANWQAESPTGVVPFKPERVVLQDFTGVPAVVDLAAMRDAMVALGGAAEDINPEIPVTLVVDHSVQVDQAGTPGAIAFNTEREFERNAERYQFLKWAQGSFRQFRSRTA